MSTQAFVAATRKKYSVLLLYPDYMTSDSGKETYYTFIDAANADEAIKRAQKEMAAANDDYEVNPEEFFCLMVAVGEHPMAIYGE